MLSADAALPASFGSFLANAYPVISAQLEANSSSRAFDDYLVAWEEEREAVENLFALSHAQAVADLSRPEESGSGGGGSKSGSSSKRGQPQRGGRSLGQSFDGSAGSGGGGGSVLDISWSCNGSVLAAAYGRSDHVGWCNHSSATLAFWNIMRRQIDVAKADFTLETECCCMCLAYHPERPTIIAGGLFNGEIRLWDTSLIESSSSSSNAAGTNASANAAEDDGASSGGAASSAASSSSDSSGNPLLMRSSIDDYYHREPIAHLEWVRDTSSVGGAGTGGGGGASGLGGWLLASVAGDGKVLFWDVGSPLTRLRFPVEGYVLAPNDKWQGQTQGQAQAQGQTQGQAGPAAVQKNKSQVLGGAAVAFVQHNPSESGGGAGTSAAGAGGSGSSHYFVASTEGGGILRVALSTIPKRKGYVKSGGGGAEGGLRWNRDAHRLLENSDPSLRFEVRKGVEKFVRSTGGDTVELEHVFGSRPPPAALYPSATNFAFESHAGPAYGLAFNKFDKRLFASASTDGKIKVFHIQNVTTSRHTTHTHSAHERAST